MYLIYCHYFRMHGAHACLVPVNYFVASIFEYLQAHGKPHTSIRAADLRHFLLLLPFVLDNLLKDEVDKYNEETRHKEVMY